MTVVNLEGGPKKITFVNNTDRDAFIDFEHQGDELNAKRIVIKARERKEIRVAMKGKYVTVISPPGIRMVCVEEQ